eukprot:1123492-Amorphochlora_amoeboformis.AAC.1
MEDMSEAPCNHQLRLEILFCDFAFSNHHSTKAEIYVGRNLHLDGIDPRGHQPLQAWMCRFEYEFLGVANVYTSLLTVNQLMPIYTFEHISMYSGSKR